MLLYFLYISDFICSSVDGQLNGFQFFDTVNKAAINMGFTSGRVWNQCGVRVSTPLVWVWSSLGCVPRMQKFGSYGSFTFGVLRTLQTDLPNFYNAYLISFAGLASAFTSGCHKVAAVCCDLFWGFYFCPVVFFPQQTICQLKQIVHTRPC